jgi:cytoskeletal protein CcmA (bactofilin family)
MFSNDKKPQKPAKIETLIGQNTEVSGDIFFAGGIHIDGHIKGNVVADSESASILQLSENGSIEGEVRVPTVKLNGTVRGDVHASQHVELASKARITGDVYYNLIEMAIGAEVNGSLVHSTDSSTVKKPVVTLENKEKLKSAE